MKSQFKIVHFDDYHEGYSDKSSYKHYFELGCFRPKRGNYSYNRYFFVYYDKKPTKQQIINSLNQLIQKQYTNLSGRMSTNLELDVRYP